MDSSSSRYRSRIYRSRVKDATVRIAETASEAKAVLSANLRSTSASSLKSSRIRRKPQKTMSGRAPKITTRPSFQPTMSARMQLEIKLMMPVKIRVILKLSNSLRDCGLVESAETKAPVVFSGLSKNSRSCLTTFLNISSRYLYVKFCFTNQCIAAQVNSTF